MATKKELNKDEVKEVVETKKKTSTKPKVKKEDVLETKSNRESELENTILEMQKQMALLMSQMNNKKEETKIEKVEEIDESKIESKRVTLINMMPFHGVYTSPRGREYEFFEFGDTVKTSFSEVEDLTKGKFRRWFQECEIMIADEDVAKHLGFDNIYKNHGITVDGMSNLFELDGEEMMEKVKKLTKPLQLSFAKLFVKECLNDNIHCTRNKQLLVMKYFKIPNMDSILQTYEEL